MSRTSERPATLSRTLRTLLAVLGAALIAIPLPNPLPIAQVERAQAAPSAAPVASGWVLNKFPQGAPTCTGVGYPGAIYYDRLDCGFGWVSVSETTPSSVVKVSVITSDGVVRNTQTTTYRAAEVAWQFAVTPAAAWPAGEVTVRVVEVNGTPGNFGETSILLLNQLGATIAAAAGSYSPGSAIPVSGTIFELDQIPPVAGEQKTNVGAAFSLRVTWPDGTVRGPYGPFTANPGPLNTGTFSASIPGAATSGLTADASTNFKATVALEVINASYTDPLTGVWTAARAGSGSVTFSIAPTSLQLENSFVSSVGWVKPGETYPFRVLVKNYMSTARAGAAVTIPVPDGTTFTAATALAGSGTCVVNGGGAISWTVGSVAAATGGVPTIKTCVVEARADTLDQDPQIVWKNLSSVATLTYTGGPAGLTSTSHGPKVIPPKATFDTARFGDRPFPVVPVDWFDRKHDVAHSGETLSDKINSASIPGSTFNLYQEMSYGQLFPNGTVPSAGLASAGWTYGPGFNFSQPSPGGTCTGATFSAAAGTAIYPERIVGGWYQMPGDTGYYGSDATGTALVGAQAGVGPLMQIDNGCGPTGKAVFDAAQIADPEIDYSDYDTDKDGVVDFFMMVFVGVGGHGASQTSVPPYDNIWPHSSSLEFGFTDQGPYEQDGYVSDDQLKDLEGQPLYYTSSAATAMTTTVTAFPVYVRVGPYNVNPEDSIDNASVISHEYGHSLGLPDYYTLGTTRSTYGDWNLMATDKSQHMDVNAKQELGWLVPRVLGPGLTDVNDWSDSKGNTHQITWQQPNGAPYTLSGSGVNNGEAYVAKLPTRFIMDPAKFDGSGPGEGASPDHVWWSESGNDFGCAPVGGHNLDIYLPELADLPSGTPVTVNFKSYWDIEWDYDYGFVMMSTDGGETYTSLASDNGYTELLNPQAAACQTKYGNGITGASGSYEAGTQNVDRLTSTYPDGGFLPDQYDLSAGVGSPTVLRFSYSSDPGLARPGWFIDDLVVTAGSQVIYETDFETSGDPDDARVFSGGCKDSLSVAAQCTDGWRYINAAEGSPADHAYYLEMRDRSGFDEDGKGENDRAPIAFAPGMLLVYTDEAHGYGNVGVTDPPAQTPLDSQPQAGVNTPNLNDAAWTAAAGDKHFSDSGAGWIDNYKDPSSADGFWHFAWNCLTFDVQSMTGTNIGPGTVPPYNLEGDVRFNLGAGCAQFDYGHGGGGAPVNQAPTAVAAAQPTTVATGETVTFDAGGSFDDQQAPQDLSYAWDLDDNGTFETPGQTVQRSFAVAGTYQATVRVTDQGNLSDTDSVTVTVTGVDPCPPYSPTGTYSDDFESGSDGWTVDTAANAVPASLPWAVGPDPLAQSGTSSFSSDATTLDLKDDRLISPAVDLSAESQLTFWHRYGFEDTFDGGVLEVSTDSGSTWTDVLAGGGSFAQGGYSGAISGEYNSPIAGRSAWTGPAESALNPMTKVVANLGAYAGTGVIVRFRLAADPITLPGSLPGAGWWIDDVSFTKLSEPSTCENHAPIADDDAATTTMDTAVTVNVVGNDGDPDGDPITVSGVNQPDHGTVDNNNNGTVTYTPDSGYSGPDSFTYTIDDGRGGTDTANVAINVTTAGNSPPNANNDTATTQEETPVDIDVLANDNDPNGDSLLVSGFSDPANGSVVNNGDGTVTYTPDAGFTGTDTFTYTVSDGRGGNDTANVSVTVTEAPNRPPDAVNDQATTTRDTAVRVNVIANDTDQDGDSLTVTTVTDPPNGSVDNNGDGTVTYTPDTGFTGTDSFTYTISDGNGGSDTASVTVFVNAPSDTAKASGGGWIQSGNAKSNFSFNAEVKNMLAKGKIGYSRANGGISLKGTVDALRVAGPPAGSPPATGSVADFSGSCTLANGARCTYTAHAEDHAEPGTGWDIFSIRVFDASGALIHEASGVLGSGNIQIH